MLMDDDWLWLLRRSTSVTVAEGSEQVVCYNQCNNCTRLALTLWWWHMMVRYWVGGLRIQYFFEPHFKIMQFTVVMYYMTFWIESWPGVQHCRWVNWNVDSIGHDSITWLVHDIIELEIYHLRHKTRVSVCFEPKARSFSDWLTTRNVHQLELGIEHFLLLFWFCSLIPYSAPALPFALPSNPPRSISWSAHSLNSLTNMYKTNSNLYHSAPPPAAQLLRLSISRTLVWFSLISLITIAFIITLLIKLQLRKRGRDTIGRHFSTTLPSTTTTTRIEDGDVVVDERRRHHHIKMDARINRFTLFLI